MNLIRQLPTLANIPAVFLLLTKFLGRWRGRNKCLQKTALHLNNRKQNEGDDLTSLRNRSSRWLSHLNTQKREVLKSLDKKIQKGTYRIIHIAESDEKGAQRVRNFALLRPRLYRVNPEMFFCLKSLMRFDLMRCEKPYRTVQFMISCDAKEKAVDPSPQYKHW